MPGRRKLNRESLHARVAPNTAEKLKEIAGKLGYLYNEEGSTGQLLDAIANGEIILVVANKASKTGWHIFKTGSRLWLWGNKKITLHQEVIKIVQSNGNGQKDYNPEVEFEYVDADVWYEINPQTGERINVTYTDEIINKIEDSEEEDNSSSESE